MEKLTLLRFEDTERVEAYCPICRKWIIEVDVIQNCHPYNRDYAMCPDCHTGIARSSYI